MNELYFYVQQIEEVKKTNEMLRDRFDNLSSLEVRTKIEDLSNDNYLCNSMDTFMSNTLTSIDSLQEIAYTNDMDRKSEYENTVKGKEREIIVNNYSRPIKVASMYPILTNQDIKEWFLGILQIKEIKITTSIIILIFTAIFGPASALHWCLVVTSVFNFITIKMKPKGRGRVNKNIQKHKNIQIFVLPWIYVAILNVISILLNEGNDRLGISLGFSGAVIFYIGLFIVVLTEIGNVFKNLKEAGVELPSGLETIRRLLLKKLISMLELSEDATGNENNTERVDT